MEKLTIPKIKNGTVIDHQTPGTVYKAAKILGLDKPLDDNIASTAMNVKSGRMPNGKKDILKIENRELDPDEVDKIALISPYATINIIRDYDIVDKRRVELPDDIVGIVKCSNPNCITHEYKIKNTDMVKREPIDYRFKVINKDKPVIKCYYCERELESIFENLIF
jgi:aspartate carbamoyltransferase regulatory subunit